MSIDGDFFAALNPYKSLNERPNADALLEMKMLIELGKGTKDGIEKLLGTGAAASMSSMLKNELKFVAKAMEILHTNQRIRDALGGETYENLAKLTAIIKRRSDRAFVEQYLDSVVVAPKDMVDAGYKNPFGSNLEQYYKGTGMAQEPGLGSLF